MTPVITRIMRLVLAGIGGSSAPDAATYGDEGPNTRQMRFANRFRASIHGRQSDQAVIQHGSSVVTNSLLIWILLIATVLRLASALYQGNTVTDLPGVYDQISYDGLARRVLEGHGFSFAEGHWPATHAGKPTAHWSYLYTLYLAGVYTVVGMQPLIARLIQALIAGLLHPWLTWRIGRRLFGVKAGIIAAALSAVYIYFFYYAGALITETFYLISILWTFDVATRILFHSTDNQGRQTTNPVPLPLWIELGVAIGLSGLLRQLFLIFAPFLCSWLWWNLPVQQLTTTSVSARLRQTLRSPVIRNLAVTGAIVVLLIAPWTLRNYYAFGTFVPLNTNAGFALYWGNHPIHGTHFISLLNDGQYRALIPEELLPLNEAALDRALLERGIGFITAEPGRFGWLSLSRIAEYFKFWPTSESGMVSNFARVGSFGLLLPFMLYGLWQSFALVRTPVSSAVSSSLILLYLFMLIYTGIHLASWTLIRYRLPVDLLLILFAGRGIAGLAAKAWHSTESSAPLSSEV